MSNVPGLQILADNRDALLLAEAIGWLHDYRKCSDEHLKTQAANLSNQQAMPRNTLATNHPHLTGVNLQLPVQSAPRAITDLLNDNTWNNDFLGQLLSRCHNTAHFDKQEPAGGKQNFPALPSDPQMQISSPFGFERAIPRNLTSQLWGLPWNELIEYGETQRKTLQRAVSTLFSQTVADTRRPINEVDLWGWGMLVGALYKSALAGALLTGTTPAASDLRWRLLAVRVNGLDYLLNAARIPDLLARQELLTDGLNRVRELLEITYPSGSEVYRDENGSIFVVPNVTGPNVTGLLDCTDNSGTRLRALILQAFAEGTVKGKPNLRLGGEIVPHLELEQSPWWGQDPDWEAKTQITQRTNQPEDSQLYGQKLDNELPSIANLLTQNIESFADPDVITAFWQGKEADICPVCGLRPQGPGRKAKDRNVCDICEERRADRSQAWANSQPDQTIWTTETADANGRLALIVGQFDLTHWLDGNLVETLLVIAPDNSQNPVSKTPSFSRLRRIWETTRTFWSEVQDEALKGLSDDRRRLKIYLTGKPDLGPYHVYDLQLGQTELDVVWVPPQDNVDGYLLTADNLGYIARRLDAKKDIYEHPATAAIFIEDHLREQFLNANHQPILHNPDAPAGQKRANLLDGIRIRDLNYQQNRYATAIPILAEPRTFMLLVPADRALELVKAIQSKYEREMGKVRNRLPLHLGAVFFGRRAPLFAALDSARQMLQQPVNSEQWRVSSVDGNGQIKFENGITWNASTVMGDGQTPDVWYPYWRVEGEPSGRARWFIGPDGEHWVHVNDLREGDTVTVTPSTFDFLWLDAAARRFEVHYEKGRRSARPTRPYYLEDLDRLEEVWGAFSKLTRTQVKQTLQTIETTRERWFGPNGLEKSTKDGTFRQLVADTLANAGLVSLRALLQAERSKQQSSPLPAAEIASPPGATHNDMRENDDPAQTTHNDMQTQLITAAVRGELTDWAELHLEILKEKA